MSESLIKPAISGFLSNGLKYIFQSGNSEPVICLQLYIKIGSAWEKEDEAGFAHFMEHLTFKSTDRFPSNQIAAYIYKFGGSINAYTDFDCTCYYISLPSEFVKEGLQVLAELAMHSTFIEEDVELEKDIILEEMVQNTLDPETNFLQLVQYNAFTNHPLKRPVLGTKESINAATYKRLKEFYLKYYQPHNSFLVIAGQA
ncbi:MAG: pitrilysin family protein, partial [Candidatus Cloacimonetes bacterium]